jgi:acyl-CoA thioester hydrolase
MSDLPYSELIRVRFRDTHGQQHLYFVNYLVYADEIANLFMHDLGYSNHEVSASDSYVFTVNVQCDYLGECKALDTVQVSTGYSRLGNSSADVVFEITLNDSGDLLARGRFTQVFADKKTRKSTPMPTALREAIIERQPELA